MLHIDREPDLRWKMKGAVELARENQNIFLPWDRILILIGWFTSVSEAREENDPLAVLADLN